MSTRGEVIDEKNTRNESRAKEPGKQPEAIALDSRRVAVACLSLLPVECPLPGEYAGDEIQTPKQERKGK